MTITLVLGHQLPLWFLVFALVLPRVTLVVAWLQGVLLPFHLHGWLPLGVALLLPRVLVLWLIYLDQGISPWFAVHLVAALAVWGSSGGWRRRRRRQEY
ncbi:MAG: hypothetical protein KGK08_03605 [Acidobacteriota bacterium]|nr:hypothetical protein [Acidobacteriota bacterium]